MTGGLLTTAAYFVLGTGPGVGAGLLLGLSRPIRAAARPAPDAVPYVVCSGLLLLLPRAISATAGTLLSATAAALLVLTSTGQVEEQYWEIACHFGAGPLDLWQTVVLPGAGRLMAYRLAQALAAALVGAALYAKGA